MRCLLLVITFLATQVGVDATTYMQYAWQGRTIEYHRAQIREALGFRELSVADGEQMQQWLVTPVLPQEHQDERLREQAYAWFDGCTGGPYPASPHPFDPFRRSHLRATVLRDHACSPSRSVTSGLGGTALDRDSHT